MDFKLSDDVDVISVPPLSKEEIDWIYTSSFRPTRIYKGILDPDRSYKDGPLVYSFDEKKFEEAWKRYFHPQVLSVIHKTKLQKAIKSFLEKWNLI